MLILLHGGQRVTQEKTQLILYVYPDSEVSSEELAESTMDLREEILELDIEQVDFVSSEGVPPQSKGDPSFTWGTLLLTLAASGGVLTVLINLLKEWLTRHERRRVMLEMNGDKLEVTGVSSEEQQRLIDKWLIRNGKRAEQ
jgi:hypothetical protein